jgi:hypothetical protein
MHHESLYIEHLPNAIKEKYKGTGDLSQLEIELFIDTSLAWELGEIEMVGYVGLFHLWEKYSKDFISKVLGSKCRGWPKTQGRLTYPQKVFTHLESLDINISADTLNEIEEANTVVNAYKHGEEAIEKLMEVFPKYFCVTAEPESFHIPNGALKILFETIFKFWREIESQIEPDFNF